MMTDNKFKQIFPFQEPRRLQRKVIEKIMEYFHEGYNHIVINAPTGIGKSVIGMAISNAFLTELASDLELSSYILTSQKMLQDQYVDDFTIPTVKGRSNYPCTYVGGKTTCDIGPCINMKWTKSSRLTRCPKCPYYTARDSTYKESISVLNYAYFLNMGYATLCGEVELQTKRKLLILDECLRAGTKVKTAEGDKNIEDIKIGDSVYSYNIETKTYEYKQVTKLHKNLPKSNSYDYFLEIELENGKILQVTPNHKIYTENRGYVRADELTEDDNLNVFQSNDTIFYKSIKKIPRNNERVYNIEVEDNHNYLANDILVSNCHSVESHLLNFSAVTIDRFKCKKYNLYDSILNFPKESDTDEAKFYWLFENVHPQIIDAHKKEISYLESITPADNNYRAAFKKATYLKDLKCNISNIKEEYEAGRACAIMQNKDKDITFKPIFGKALATKYLLPFASKTLSMSATVLSKDQYCRDMGFPKEDTMFIRLPSLFPIENRKIYSLGIGSMSYANKHETLPKIGHTVELLLEKHKNERGIIHTANYETAEYLITYLNNNRLVMPRGKTRDAEIKMFMNSTSNSKVLISPSLQEGIDLKDDLSRFTIVVKMPYANLMDDWVKKRMELSPRWYTENTIMNLIQSTGRSVRTETDYATAYILDSNFEWFYKKNKNKFLDWWKNSLISKV